MTDFLPSWQEKYNCTSSVSCNVFTSLKNIWHLISSFTLLIGGRIMSKIVVLYRFYIFIRAIFFNPAICSPRRQPYKHITQRRRSSLFVYIFHIYYCYSPKDYSQPPPKICFHLFWYCELIQIIMDETFWR